MRVSYIENGDLASFNGLAFRRDKRTGYYLNSTERKRLHRAVWEFHYGEIPTGFHIHHIDGDKSNNRIENLSLVSASEHESFHGTKYSSENREKVINNLIKHAIPKAAEWHKSENGRAWHSKHGKKVAENMQAKDYDCLHCGKKFSKKPFGENKFCANACKSAYRRAKGIDNEKRTCEVCGNEFIVDKYSGTKTCSRSCASRLCWNKRLALCGQS